MSWKKYFRIFLVIAKETSHTKEELFADLTAKNEANPTAGGVAATPRQYYFALYLRISAGRCLSGGAAPSHSYSRAKVASLGKH